jgi:hypothetical protein
MEKLSKIAFKSRIFMKNHVLILSILLLLVTKTNAQVYYPDKNNWESKTPSELGMNELKLKQAIDFAIAHESKENRNLKIAHYESAFGREPFGYPIGPSKTRGAASGLIIYKGYVVGKWGEPERVDLTFSVAKSILSTTAGLAVEAGLIKSEQDLVHRLQFSHVADRILKLRIGQRSISPIGSRFPLADFHSD